MVTVLQPRVLTSASRTKKLSLPTWFQQRSLQETSTAFSNPLYSHSRSPESSHRCCTLLGRGLSQNAHPPGSEGELSEDDGPEAVRTTSIDRPEPIRSSRLAALAEEYRALRQAKSKGYDVPLDGMPMGSGGFGLMAEAKMEASIRRGALEGLKGEGKPLAEDPHGAHFFEVDFVMQAMTRTMGAQNMRPESLELRDVLRKVRNEFETCLKEAVDQATSASSSSTLQELDKLRNGGNLSIKLRFDELAKVASQYNSAVLSDKENFGSHWPLHQVPKPNFGKEVERTIAERVGLEN